MVILFACLVFEWNMNVCRRFIKWHFCVMCLFTFSVITWVWTVVNESLILQKVTPWNVNKLRHAIINGSEVHPGATHYVDKSAVMKLPPSINSRISISRKLPSSRGVVTHHGKSLESEYEGKVVHRHLQDGDIVLVNRQVCCNWLGLSLISCI